MEEDYLVLGPNGSGKSTFLKIATGNLSPEYGEVSVFGKDVNTFYVKEKISYFPQDDFLISGVSVSENVNLFLELNKTCITDYIEELKKYLHITDLMNKKSKELSKGQNKLIRLFLTFSKSANIYFFDEPLAHLDEYYREKISILLQRLMKEGKRIIVVAHDYSELFKDIKNIIPIQNGIVMPVINVSDIEKSDIWYIPENDEYIYIRDVKKSELLRQQGAIPISRSGRLTFYGKSNL